MFLKIESLNSKVESLIDRNGIVLCNLWVCDENMNEKLHVR